MNGWGEGMAGALMAFAVFVALGGVLVGGCVTVGAQWLAAHVDVDVRWTP